jgi:hypothetical protein
MYTLASYRAFIPSLPRESFNRPGLSESVAKVRLERWRKSEDIGGWTRTQLVEIEKKPYVLDQFLACPSDERAVRKYTDRYGVLRFRWTDGTHFGFKLDDWLSLQKQFKKQWEAAAEGKVASVLTWLESQLTLEQQEAEDLFEPYVRYFETTSPALNLQFSLRKVRGSSGIECRAVAGDLWQGLCLLFLEKLQESKGYFRICANKSCKGQEYFIATRRDQKCCDANCSKLVADRNYWARRGKKLRQQTKKRGK